MEAIPNESYINCEGKSSNLCSSIDRIRGAGAMRCAFDKGRLRARGGESKKTGLDDPAEKFRDLTTAVIKFMIMNEK